MTDTITVQAVIENAYGNAVITNRETVHVRPPQPDEALQDWATDELFPYTGTGRSDRAVYTVTIDHCDDRPHLAGMSFEWEG